MPIWNLYSQKIQICDSNPENSTKVQREVPQYSHSVHLMLQIVNMINAEAKTL